jgi:hypothetical protein
VLGLIPGMHGIFGPNLLHRLDFNGCGSLQYALGFWSVLRVSEFSLGGRYSDTVKLVQNILVSKKL